MMRWHTVFFGIVSTLFSLACASLSAEKPAADGAHKVNDKPWIAPARAMGLTDNDIERLREHRVLIAPLRYKQSFGPYRAALTATIDGEPFRYPWFITTDSVLNAFHVLLDETFLLAESNRADALHFFLKEQWTHLESRDSLRGDLDLFCDAMWRARMSVGVALTLIEPEAIPADHTLRKPIEEEIGRIEAGKVVAKHPWLRTPADKPLAIDYASMAPTGPYTRSKAMARHARALRWLMSVPFFLERDDDLVAFALLIAPLDPDEYRTDVNHWINVLDTCGTLLGRQDNLDLTFFRQSVSPESLTAATMKTLRRKLTEKAPTSRVNDRIVFPPPHGQPAPPTARYLAPVSLPSAELFVRMTDPRSFRRAMPNTMEVAALLGSPWARKRVAELDDGRKLLAEIDAVNRWKYNGWLRDAYGEVIGTLFAEPEPEAPDFMGGEGWQIKSCHTALAGWAQLRHAMALNAKQSARYRGLTRKPAGFVEPIPEFYSRLAALAMEIHKTFRTDTFTQPSLGDVARTARGFAIKCREGFEKSGFKWQYNMGAGKVTLPIGTLTPDETRLYRAWPILDELLLPNLFDKVDVKRWQKDFDQAAERLEQLADRLDHAEIPDDFDFAAMRTGPVLSDSWRDLHDICRRLEILAHKQLRGRPFSDTEIDFIHNYGAALAHIMFYDGNSWLTPKDDAPRTAEVFFNPVTGKRLLVGVARPRRLLVLYPWKGEAHLCVGVVMPYREHVSARPLTDAEWKALLDGDSPPTPPQWLEPILAETRKPAAE